MHFAWSSGEGASSAKSLVWCKIVGIDAKNIGPSCTD